MDSITHLFLGGAIAAAIAPSGQRRAALLAGAAIDTLPDLDVLPLMLSHDPVVRMTWHRAASHSLLVLPFVAWALWACFRRRGGRVAQAPWRWFWIFQLALLAHPLVDALTVYGTQLFWPLPVPPVMVSSLFIVDPLVTQPLLAACVVAWFARERLPARRALACGLVLAGAYVGWSLLAKALVEQRAGRSLAMLGLQDAPRFSVPMPFNTLLWRVVAMTPDGFLEGETSLVADRGPIRFRAYPSDTAALRQAASFPATARLLWFNHHFARADVRNGELVLSDLRMGAEPDYTFRFAVARQEGARWVPVAPQQLDWPGATRAQLSALWQRIWHAPASDAESPLSTPPPAPG
ncbi:MAG: metal-dependent hydrolase [Lysobacter sp.]|nr:metal-dependent hydrolase [Lysobacter sp.]